MQTSVYMSNNALLIAVGNGGKNGVSIKKLYDLTLKSESIINGIITNEEAFKQEIEFIWGHYGLTKKNVSFIINSSQFISKNLTIRSSKKAEFQALVENEFLSVATLPNPLFESEVYDKRDGVTYTITTAVDEGYIGKISEVFTDMGMKINSITTPLYTSIRFFSKLSEMKKKTFIASIFDGDTYLNILFFNGKYYYSRGGRIFNEPSSPEFASEINSQITSLLHFHASERLPAPISSIHLCGYTPSIKASLCESISSATGIETSFIEKSSSITVEGKPITDKEELREDIGDYAYVVGDFLS